MSYESKSLKEFKPNDLLTKTQFRQLFCEEMKISKSTYYRVYHSDVKFWNYGHYINQQGIRKYAVTRIPYRIALGLINLVRGTTSEDDPQLEELMKFLT